MGSGFYSSLDGTDTILASRLKSKVESNHRDAENPEDTTILSFQW